MPDAVDKQIASNPPQFLDYDIPRSRDQGQVPYGSDSETSFTLNMNDHAMGINGIDNRCKTGKKRQPTIRSFVREPMGGPSSVLKKRSFAEAFGSKGNNDMDNYSDSEDDDDAGKDMFNTHCGLRTISEKVLQVLLQKR